MTIAPDDAGSAGKLVVDFGDESTNTTEAARLSDASRTVDRAEPGAVHALHETRAIERVGERLWNLAGLDADDIEARMQRAAHIRGVSALRLVIEGTAAQALP